jgi:hypothetical protein
VVVASDAVAHIDDRLGAAALEMIERNMGGAVDRRAVLGWLPPDRRAASRARVSGRRWSRPAR